MSPPDRRTRTQPYRHQRLAVRDEGEALGRRLSVATSTKVSCTMLKTVLAHSFAQPRLDTPVQPSFESGLNDYSLICRSLLNCWPKSDGQTLTNPTKPRKTHGASTHSDYSSTGLSTDFVDVSTFTRRRKNLIKIKPNVYEKNALSSWMLQRKDLAMPSGI